MLEASPVVSSPDLLQEDLLTPVKGGTADEAKGEAGKTSDRGSEKPAINLSGDETRKGFALLEGARKYLKDEELKRAVRFSERVDAEGNSSGTMRLKKPTREELDAIYKSYVDSLSGSDQKFIDGTGLATNIKKDVADFFDYGDQYRYVTFLLAGDGSATLPTVLIFESDKLYDADKASQGKLDVPAGELRLKEFGDLKVGDPKLERYGRLFDIKK